MHHFGIGLNPGRLFLSIDISEQLHVVAQFTISQPPLLRHVSYSLFLLGPGGVHCEPSSPLGWLCKSYLDPSSSGRTLMHRESVCFAIVAVVKLRQRGFGPSKDGSARRST